MPITPPDPDPPLYAAMPSSIYTDRTDRALRRERRRETAATEAAASRRRGIATHAALVYRSHREMKDEGRGILLGTKGFTPALSAHFEYFYKITEEESLEIMAKICSCELERKHTSAIGRNLNAICKRF
jgi:hypothetical protein